MGVLTRFRAWLDRPFTRREWIALAVISVLLAALLALEAFAAYVCDGNPLCS